MSKRIVLILVVIIVLMGVVGYFAFIKENETANWETYRSEEYGIEFKYPLGWYIWDGGGHVGIYIYEREVGPGLPGVSRLMIIGHHTNVTEDIKTYADAKMYGEQNTPDYSNSGGFFTLLKKDQRSVFVDRTRSYQIYIKIMGGGPLECDDSPCDWWDYENIESLIVKTYIPHKSAIFSVSVEMGGKFDTDEKIKKIDLAKEADYLHTYKQILSTFKFLD